MDKETKDTCLALLNVLANARVAAGMDRATAFKATYDELVAGGYPIQEANEERLSDARTKRQYHKLTAEEKRDRSKELRKNIERAMLKLIEVQGWIPNDTVVNTLFECTKVASKIRAILRKKGYKLTTMNRGGKVVGYHVTRLDPQPEPPPVPAAAIQPMLLPPAKPRSRQPWRPTPRHH